MLSTAMIFLVSILVFVELALGGNIGHIYTERGTRFQSLFLWNSPSEPLGDRSCRELGLVSILVFVELALGVYVPDLEGVGHLGFNPCFCGTRPRRNVQ